MSHFAHFFSVYVMWGSFPCLAIIGIFFWTKQRTLESLVLATGFVIVVLGSLIQTFFPFAKISMDEAGKILSSSGAPLIWYTGSIMISIGLIITVVGFALVTWKMKRST